MSYNDKKVMIVVNARKHLEEIIIFNTEQTLENYIKENPNIKRLGLVSRDYVSTISNLVNFQTYHYVLNIKFNTPNPY